MRANGASAPEIAQTIHVSAETVRRDFKIIIRHYDVRSIDRAVVVAIADGTLLVDEEGTVTISGA